MLFFFNSKLKFMIYFNFKTLEINFGRYLAHIMKLKITVLLGTDCGLKMRQITVILIPQENFL